jgi:hypothetical protein
MCGESVAQFGEARGSGAGERRSGGEEQYTDGADFTEDRGGHDIRVARICAGWE